MWPKIAQCVPSHQSKYAQNIVSNMAAAFNPQTILKPRVYNGFTFFKYDVQMLLKHKYDHVAILKFTNTNMLDI